MNDAIIDMIASTIEYIESPETQVSDKQFIKEFLLNCDRKVNKLIKEHSVKLREENALKPINIKCIHCGHEYQQSIIINVVDFFE
jgi:hypothetical protein